MSDEFSNLPKYTYAPRPPKFKRLPFIFVSLALIFVVATWIPLVMIARARMRRSEVRKEVSTASPKRAAAAASRPNAWTVSRASTVSPA